jgi:nucleotide-binding universal stress UspA family protein
MALKSIVCLINGFDHETTAVEAAINLAQDNGALLRLVHVHYPVYSYSGFFGEAVMVGGGWTDALDKAAKARLDKAREVAESACRRHGLPFDEIPAPSGRAHAVFSVLENRTNGQLVREMSLCDLLVLGAEKGASDIADNSVTGLALFSTGRPLLVVRPKPEVQGRVWSGRTCALAWNDSPEAIRAVRTAVDLVATAQKVHVLVTEERDRPVDAHENQVVMDYLAAHGVSAEITAVKREGEGDAEAVLRQARAYGADYMVMGAYGHSVFRELLLGGFTAYMLEEAEMSLVLAH